MSIRASDALSLPVSERIQLVAEIWDAIAASPEDIEVTPETRELLDKRLKSFRENPEASSPWPEVKRRILASKEK